MHAHTYTVHLTVTANNDAQALRIAQEINRETGRGLVVVPPGADAERYAVISMHVTDADDYAEQVEVDGLCGTCGEPAVDRLRTGVGSRVCAECAARTDQPPYPIRDIHV